jgi:hypothetical protein
VLPKSFVFQKRQQEHSEILSRASREGATCHAPSIGAVSRLIVVMFEASLTPFP